MTDKEIIDRARSFGVKEKDIIPTYAAAFRKLAERYPHVSMQQIATWAIMSAKCMKPVEPVQENLF